MSFITWIKGVFSKMFSDDAKVKFGVNPVETTSMRNAINAWMNIYNGNPPWLSESDEIRTINFAKAVCSETARLVSLNIGINISGGARADWLQEQVNKGVLPRLRSWIEYGCAGGTVIFKPNGSGIDVVTPDRILVTEQDSNRNITGIIFQDTYVTGKEYYTKLEYHRFVRADVEGEERKVYQISTKTFKSFDKGSIGMEVSIDSTKWAGIEPEVAIVKENDSQIDTMLFGVLTMPDANNIDIDSPLGMSLFSGAIEELRDLDIAYSRNASEINDSSVIELLDDRLLFADGQKRSLRAGESQIVKPGTTLPKHVHNVFGSSADEFYQQIDRPLKTDIRREGINQQLSFIGYKCGYSNGYFTFDEKSGMMTATQVESDDRRTIQLIKDIRDNLEYALDNTIYAISKMADLYGLAPIGTYTVDYEFGDITYNYDEDRQRWYQLMLQGIVPKWMYLVKFENLSEDEAKMIVAEQERSQPRLFASEE